MALSHKKQKRGRKRTKKEGQTVDERAPWKPLQADLTVTLFEERGADEWPCSPRKKKQCRARERLGTLKTQLPYFTQTHTARTATRGTAPRGRTREHRGKSGD